VIAQLAEELLAGVTPQRQRQGEKQSRREEEQNLVRREDGERE
jgi:hypothetical protein